MSGSLIHVGLLNYRQLNDDAHLYTGMQMNTVGCFTTVKKAFFGIFAFTQLNYRAS